MQGHSYTCGSCKKFRLHHGQSFEKWSTCQQNHQLHYCMLHNIAKIRPCLDTKAVQLIIQALVLSCIDYYNSLLAGSAQYQLDKLQCMQNMNICNLRKYDHVSPATRSLHWLKICERITYNLCLLVYNCHNNLAPKYLRSTAI